jgi:hypothetical protein
MWGGTFTTPNPIVPGATGTMILCPATVHSNAGGVIFSAVPVLETAAFRWSIYSATTQTGCSYDFWIRWRRTDLI